MTRVSTFDSSHTTSHNVTMTGRMELGVPSNRPATSFLHLRLLMQGHWRMSYVRYEDIKPGCTTKPAHNASSCLLERHVRGLDHRITGLSLRQFRWRCIQLLL